MPWKHWQPRQFHYPHNPSSSPSQEGHTGNYGRDLNTDFASLLRKIVKIPNLYRLRISSIEITELTDEVLDIIDEQGGNFEMDCGFCGEMYKFNKDDVPTIFSE